MQSQQSAPAGWGAAALPEKEPASAYLKGLVGALLGALAGCIPWFCASFFAGYFVGLLGFLVGIASFFGYKWFKGAKSFAYAMTMIVVCSVLAIMLSSFLENYLAFSGAIKELIETDPDWAAYMASGETTMLNEVWYNMTQPEFLGDILTNLAIGLVIGILGIVSVRRQVGAYVLSGRMPAVPEGTPAVPEQAGVPAAVGGPVPEQAVPEQAIQEPAVPVQSFQADHTENEPPQAAAEPVPAAQPVAFTGGGVPVPPPVPVPSAYAPNTSAPDGTSNV